VREWAGSGTKQRGLIDDGRRRFCVGHNAGDEYFDLDHRPLLCLIGMSLVKLPQAAKRHDDYSTETEPAEEPSQSKNTAFKRRFRYLRRSKRFHRWYLLPRRS